MLCKVKEIKVVEIDVEVGNVKFDSDVELIFVVGLTLDMDASIVEIVISVELFAAVEEVVMWESEIELLESNLESWNVGGISV